MKKTLTIIILILVLAGAGFGIWYFFFQGSSDPTKNPFGNGLPFGSGEGINLPPPFGDGLSSGSENIPGVENGKPAQNLFRVAEAPVAGAVVLGQGASTTVRYTDRATGHIYETNLATLETRKITNTTLPKIYEAIFSSDGSRVLFRSLSESGEVENLSLALTPPVSTSTDALYTSSATVLRGGMSEVEAGSGNSIFYVLSDASSITTSTFEGTGQRNILTMPFTAWRLDSYGSGLLAWTKASASVPGYAYRLNTSNGSLTKLLGPLNGLSVSPSSAGGNVLFSYNDTGDTRLFAKLMPSDEDVEILPATLAEKCVWGRAITELLVCGAPSKAIEGGEPDNWYKGITHFSDNLWKIDAETTETLLAAEPEKLYGIKIDVYEPQISIDDSYMVFINKNDLSLWALRLN